MSDALDQKGYPPDYNGSGRDDVDGNTLLIAENDALAARVIGLEHALNDYLEDHGLANLRARMALLEDVVAKAREEVRDYDIELTRKLTAAIAALDAFDGKQVKRNDLGTVDHFGLDQFGQMTGDDNDD